MDAHVPPLDTAVSPALVRVHLVCRIHVPAVVPPPEPPPVAAPLAPPLAVHGRDRKVPLEGAPFRRADHHGPPGADPLAGLALEFPPNNLLPVFVHPTYGRVAGPLKISEEAHHPGHAGRPRGAFLEGARPQHPVDQLDVPLDADRCGVLWRHAGVAAVHPVVATSVQRLAAVAVNVWLVVRPTIVVAEYHRPRYRPAADGARPSWDIVLLIVGEVTFVADIRVRPGTIRCVLSRPLLSFRRAIQAEAFYHELLVGDFYLEFEVDGRRVQQRSRVFVDLQFYVAVAVQGLRLRDVDVDSAHLVAQGEHSTELFLHRPHVR